MRGVRVYFRDGNEKMYKCTGYDLKNYNFKSGKELGLYLFNGKGKKPTVLKKRKIKTWKVEN